METAIPLLTPQWLTLGTISLAMAIVTESHNSDLGGDKPGDGAHELVPMEKPQIPHTAILGLVIFRCTTMVTMIRTLGRSKSHHTPSSNRYTVIFLEM
jgi:hypothetical protein